MSRMNRRILALAIYLTIGSVLCVLSFHGMVDEFWGGMGTGAIFIGVLRIVQIIRFKTDEVYAEKMEVKVKDERNRYLAEKARSLAFYYYCLAAAVAAIVLRIANYAAYAVILADSVCGLMVLYWICWIYLQKKY